MSASSSFLRTSMGYVDSHSLIEAVYLLCLVHCRHQQEVSMKDDSHWPTLFSHASVIADGGTADSIACRNWRPSFNTGSIASVKQYRFACSWPCLCLCPCYCPIPCLIISLLMSQLLSLRSVSVPAPISGHVPVPFISLFLELFLLLSLSPVSQRVRCVVSLLFNANYFTLQPNLTDL